MFSATTRLGAGGTKDIALSDTANAVLNATFAVVGLMSGGINNCESLDSLETWLVLFSFLLPVDLGPKVTLCIGTLGYALYVGALWWYVLSTAATSLLVHLTFLSFQAQGTRWFLIAAGVVVGATAALLWSAQGSIMMSYPLEKDKGKAIGIFWAIFQSGSLLGSIIALAINIETGGMSAVSTSTYIVRFLTGVFK